MLAVIYVPIWVPTLVLIVVCLLPYDRLGRKGKGRRR
jgi:hypothetical protein